MGCGSSALPVNPLDSVEETLKAIMNGSLPPEALDSVLNRSNVNTKFDIDDVKDLTPLIMATSAGNLPATKAVLALGPDLSVTDGEGNTALHIAVKADRPDLVTELITAGSNVNSKNEDGCPILRTAIIENEDPNILEKLLQAGAKTDYTEPEPPLQTAAEKGKIAHLQLLLQKHANPNGVKVKLPSGESVDLLTWATKGGHSSIVGILALGGNDDATDLPAVARDDEKDSKGKHSDGKDDEDDGKPADVSPKTTKTSSPANDDDSKRQGGDGAEHTSQHDEENDVQEATPAPKPDSSEPAEAMDASKPE
ncbi:serine/threonine-protein phosphatase 6 regulatory ankyrin repeat subunit C [Hyalella azteca]|uniref:Serine/threonine-protein phosphatase 6 regulatory ankyrin repeat subunit C n=1 Tax=Hyalella azteca TaxID=294128 RepID=A0A8B7NM61_HYAAZ|nr:serine/threonine-protein phosphatase 6 regulatory ankyrin repeat subunit C [Hyalella azteca]